MNPTDTTLDRLQPGDVFFYDLDGRREHFVLISTTVAPSVPTAAADRRRLEVEVSRPARFAEARRRSRPTPLTHRWLAPTQPVTLVAQVEL